MRASRFQAHRLVGWTVRGPLRLFGRSALSRCALGRWGEADEGWPTPFSQIPIHSVGHPSSALPAPAARPGRRQIPHAERSSAFAANRLAHQIAPRTPPMAQLALPGLHVLESCG